METNDQYLARARRETIAKEWDMKHAPLKERREAREEFRKAMAEDPALVAERLGWVFDGNYGQGEMIRAKETLANKRMNRRAMLCQLVGMYEWQCPQDFCIEAWKTLTSAQKKTLDEAIDVVIEAAEKEEE